MVTRSNTARKADLEKAVAESFSRYAARNPRSREEDLKAADYMPGGNTRTVIFHPPFPLTIARGEGQYVEDIDQNRYTNFVGEFGAGLFGHSNPDIAAAITRAVSDGWVLGGPNRYERILAAELVNRFPSIDRIRFTNSGTEANMMAISISRVVSGRSKVMVFEGAYHGASETGVTSLFPRGNLPFPFPELTSAGTPAAERQVLVAPFNDADVLRRLLTRHAGEVAAVIVEPLQRCTPPLPGFLEAVRAACTAHDVLLIFDEVVTGFRLAYGGAQEYYGVVPDLAALGKIIGGGYPLAAVAGSSEIMSYFSRPDARGVPVAQVGTLNGNPIAAAAGLATLEILRRPGSYERLEEVGQRLRDQLQATLREHEVPGQVLGEGPIFHLVFTDQPVQNYRDMLTGDSEKNRVFHEALMANGVLKPAAKGYASLVHSDEDLAETAKVFDAAMAQVARLS